MHNCTFKFNHSIALWFILLCTWQNRWPEGYQACVVNGERTTQRWNAETEDEWEAGHYRWRRTDIQRQDTVTVWRKINGGDTFTLYNWAYIITLSMELWLPHLLKLLITFIMKLSWERPMKLWPPHTCYYGIWEQYWHKSNLWQGMADSLGGQESDPRKEKSEWSVGSSRVLVFSYSSVPIPTAMPYLFTYSDLTDGSRACTKPVNSAVLLGRWTCLLS